MLFTALTAVVFITIPLSTTPIVPQPNIASARPAWSMVPAVLIPRDSTPKPAPDSGAVYVCPMHAEVHSNHPGKCPKCGMTLVKQKAKPSKPPTVPNDTVHDTTHVAPVAAPAHTH